ncbi:MAG TPA: hypothetical protein VFP11_00275 [Candidatus Angelobacter sp.]|nr:hypothetical protein [Candidatus Angelobacter sp.]
MVSRRAAHRDPLDALVREVWHVELSACEGYEEFREGVRRMTHNLELTLVALAGLKLSNIHIRRAADQLKLSSLRLLEMCREVPDALQGPEDWRHTMTTIMANYEQFRNQAGRLYRLAVPAAAFNLLRTAL